MTRAPSSRRRGPPPPDVLAAELALGVLDDAERAAAEARAAADPAFAAEAADWSARLHPLADEAPPVEPDPALWARIAAVLPPGTGAQNVSEAPAPTPPPAEPPIAQVVESAPRQVRRWRRLAGFATGLAAACVVAVVVLLARHPVAPAPLLTARLEPPGGVSVLPDTALYTATVDRSRAAVVLTAVGPGPVDPRVRELWVIGKPGKPRAVGVIQAGRRLALPHPALAETAAGATLAVSLEPPGGSPTGAPTGPVIATGVLQGA